MALFVRLKLLMFKYLQIYVFRWIGFDEACEMFFPSFYPWNSGDVAAAACFLWGWFL